MTPTTSTYSAFTIMLRGSSYSYLTDEETEVQRGSLSLHNYLLEWPSSPVTL